MLIACGIYGGGALCAWSKSLYPASISQNSWCVEESGTVSCAWHECLRFDKDQLMENHHNSIE